MSDNNQTTKDNSKIERETGAPLLPGEKYCGERYRFSLKNKSVAWHGPKGEIRIAVDAGFDTILDSLERLGKSHGSFKILPGGVVSTKLGDDNVPVFVCHLDAPFVFDVDIDMNSSSCTSGSLWLGFYDGCRSAFSGDKVWWTKPVDWDENTFVAKSGRWGWERDLPSDILDRLKMLKPDGGSFRVTSSGHVVTLILAGENRFSKYADEFDSMSDLQQNLVYMYMREFMPDNSVLKENMMNMLPVYVGQLPENFLPIRFTEPPSYTEQLDSGARAAILEFLGKPSNAKVATITDHLEETMHNSPDMDDEDEGVDE